MHVTQSSDLRPLAKKAVPGQRALQLSVPPCVPVDQCTHWMTVKTPSSSSLSCIPSDGHSSPPEALSVGKELLSLSLSIPTDPLPSPLFQTNYKKNETLFLCVCVCVCACLPIASQLSAKCSSLALGALHCW